MFSSSRNFNRRVTLTKKRSRELIQKIWYGKERQHQMNNHRPLKLDKMHNEAFFNYHIAPLDIKIDLLKVEADEIYYAHDPKHFGWKELALKGVEKHMIPGNHDSMFKSPNDVKLGNILQNVLQNNQQ